MIRAETAINTTGRYSLRGDCKSQDKNVNEITYYFETSLNIIEISEIQTSFSKNENHQWEKIELILVPPTACNGIFWRRKLLTEIEDMRKNTWIKICLGCSYECELCGSQPSLCSIITSVFCVLLTGAMMKKLALNLLKVSTRVYVCFLSYLEGFYSGESLQVFWIWHRTLHNMCSDKRSLLLQFHMGLDVRRSDKSPWISIKESDM